MNNKIYIRDASSRYDLKKEGTAVGGEGHSLIGELLMDE